MKRHFLWVFVGLLVFGCASPNSQHYQQIVNKEVSRLAAPSRPLSTYSSFELNGMILDDFTQSKADKTRVAAVLENKIESKVSPLFSEWNRNPKSSGKKLVITPELYELHVVSSGARFFIGGMAGDSRLDLGLNIVDADTQEVIGRPRIILSASGISGGWSVGGTDKNMLNYAADITYQYLKDHY